MFSLVHSHQIRCCDKNASFPIPFFVLLLRSYHPTKYRPLQREKMRTVHLLTTTHRALTANHMFQWSNLNTVNHTTWHQTKCLLCYSSETDPTAQQANCPVGFFIAVPDLVWMQPKGALTLGSWYHAQACLTPRVQFVWLVCVLEHSILGWKGYFTTVQLLMHKHGNATRTWLQVFVSITLWNHLAKMGGVYEPNESTATKTVKWQPHSLLCCNCP